MLLGEENLAMVSDFGLSRDVYESGEYESTSGVWPVFSCLKNGESSYNDIYIYSSSYIVLQRFFLL